MTTLAVSVSQSAVDLLAFAAESTLRFRFFTVATPHGRRQVCAYRAYALSLHQLVCSEGPGTTIMDIVVQSIE
jgi:hypothetical protein